MSFSLGEENEEDLESAVGQMDLGMESTVAATRIQSSFRGYSVRRCRPLSDLRVIDGVRHSLAALQARASDPTYIERICTDEVECRKLTEGIMALLLKLDALQNVHAAVRGVRKSMSREVVQFMEVIDAVVGAEPSPLLESRNSSSMVCPNSIPHLDRSSSPPLRRVMSLNNDVCPDVPESDNVSALEALGSREGRASDAELDLTAEMADNAAHNMARFAASGAEEEAEGPLMRSSELENKARHQDAGTVGLMSTETAALVIQSRFRGYRVRRSRPLKHLRKISNVKTKLRELSVLASSPGFPLKLRLDAMERVKLTEGITALLLELDSVQGVDQVVRDIRKSATREVFKLQESVDAMITEAAQKSTLSSLRSDEGLQGPRTGVQLSGDAPVVPGRASSFDSDDFVIVGDEGSLGVLEDNSSPSENLQRMGSQTRYTSGDELDKAGPLSPPDEQKSLELDHATVSPSNEFGGPGRGLHDDVLQVSVADIPMMNSPTLRSYGSAAEDEENDGSFGPCAAVVAATNSTSDDRRAQHGTVPLTALRRDSFEDGIHSRPLHFGDKKGSKLGEKWEDKYVAVLDADTQTYPPAESNGREDMQASAILCEAGKSSSRKTSASLVRHVYDAQHMGTVKEVKEVCTLSNGVNATSTRETVEPANNVEITDEDSMHNSLEELDLIVQKFNFIPNSCLPYGAEPQVAQFPAGIAPHCEGNGHFQGNIPCELHAIHQMCTQETANITRRHFHEGRPPMDALESSPLPLTSPEPRSQCTATAEPMNECVPGGVQTPTVSSDEGFLPALGTSLESSDMDVDDIPSVAVVESKKRHHNGEMGLVNRLVDENTKLRSLLNEVLIFAEKQSAKATTAKVKLEKMENEIVQYRKRDEALRKKSKTARRARRS